jgi:hypothetical protein
MIGFGFLPIAVVVVGLIWWLLEFRERKRALAGAPRLATWRLIFAAVFALVALFSGGCSLLLLGDLTRGSQQYIDVPTVLIIGGIPFAVSLLIWWLFMWRKI